MLRTLCYLLAISALACGGGNGLSESTGSDGAARAASLSPEALAAIAHQALWEPSASDLAVQAPDSFLATFETSAGDFVVAFYRDWAPLGVDRVYHLTRYDFFAGARVLSRQPRAGPVRPERPARARLRMGGPDDPGRSSGGKQHTGGRLVREGRSRLT